MRQSGQYARVDPQATKLKRAVVVITAGLLVMLMVASVADLFFGEIAYLSATLIMVPLIVLLRRRWSGWAKVQRWIDYGWRGTH